MALLSPPQASDSEGARASKTTLESHCAQAFCLSKLGIVFARWAAMTIMLCQRQAVVDDSLVHGIAWHIMIWESTSISETSKLLPGVEEVV